MFPGSFAIFTLELMEKDFLIQYRFVVEIIDIFIMYFVSIKRYIYSFHFFKNRIFNDLPLIFEEILLIILA